MAQPSDGGRYFCVVRNIFTNQTRRAPRPIILIVEPVALIDYYKRNRRPLSTYYSKESEVTDNANFQPRIVYPFPLNNLEGNETKIIDFHVVAGQTIILECVIWGAKVIWNKADYSLKPITLTDDRARIRQIWGNLRIKQVSFLGFIRCSFINKFISYSLG